MSSLGRRALLAGASIALAAADAALALARDAKTASMTGNIDSPLLSDCAEFHRRHAAMHAVPGHDDTAFSAANRARWDAAEIVEDIAAATHAGQVAKAEVALVLLEENSREGLDGHISVALSALRDVARPGSLPHAAASLTQPPSCDASLLMACADFQLACVEQRRRHVTEDGSDALAEAFYATLARVEALAPVTPEGIKAKALAAQSALLDQIHNVADQEWRDEASPEERVVMDMLQHILDGVVA